MVATAFLFFSSLFEGSLPSFSFSHSTSKSSSVPTKSSKKSLASYFENQSSICEHVVNFPETQTQKIYKKQLFIENLTEMTTNFKIHIKNFHGTSKQKTCSNLEKVLVDLGWREKNEFVEKMNEYGIVIVVKDEKGPLGPKESKMVEILLYSETWGIYLEEVGITVGELPEFSFSILVEVLGTPIEYPILKNAPIKDPIIRFGLNFKNFLLIFQILQIWIIFFQRSSPGQNPKIYKYFNNSLQNHLEPPDQRFRKGTLRRSKTTL